MAYKVVKANRGAGGIDGVSFEDFEKDFKNNMYKLWNRMASGSYFPRAVRGVEIPKKNGEYFVSIRPVTRSFKASFTL